MGWETVIVTQTKNLHVLAVQIFSRSAAGLAGHAPCANPAAGGWGEHSREGVVLLVLRGTALCEPALRVVGGRTPPSGLLLVATAHILSASPLHRVLDTLTERLIILGHQA